MYRIPSKVELTIVLFLIQSMLQYKSYPKSKSQHAKFPQIKIGLTLMFVLIKI